MTTEQLEKLLNTACEIIIELEYAISDKELQDKVNTLFQEIKYSDELDIEMVDNYTEEDLVGDLVWDENGIGRHSVDADLEAQDFEVFGKDKI